MTVQSKYVHFSCYEVGHTWHPSCTKTSLEMAIIGLIESMKIYGVVYALLTLLEKRENWTKEFFKEMLLHWFQSACFLATNAVGYIYSFCVLRYIFQRIGYYSASFWPGFLGSLLAIFIERPSRRSLLAVYVVNNASECFWNALVYKYDLKPIPRGEVLIFCFAMSIISFFFKSTSTFSPMLSFGLRLLIGNSERGKCTQEILNKIQCQAPPETLPSKSWYQKLLSVFKTRHSMCPHFEGCLPYVLIPSVKGFLSGVCLQAGLKFIFNIPQLLRNPLLLLKIIKNKNNVNLGLFLGLFITAFKGICCLGRWIFNEDQKITGVLAGSIAGLSMYFYSMKSLATYAFWKTIEGLYISGHQAGILPKIPYAVELIYALATAYLFHIAVVDLRSMKPSYWMFLYRLTWGRIYEYNRYLLLPLGVDKSRIHNPWPDYDKRFLSDFYKTYFQRYM